MKYFTPELFMQLNSLDVDEAEQADEKWQQEEAAYKERLATIRGQMPSQVVRLSELCLHDARVVSREEFTEPAGGPFFFHEPYPFRVPLWSAVAIVSVALGEEVISLIYCLGDHATKREAPEGWRFSKLQEQWLYDEVDMIEDRRGLFVHRILFSTGATLEIPFVSVLIHRFRVPVTTPSAKQIA
jgi:hypothetical protein